MIPHALPALGPIALEQCFNEIEVLLHDAFKTVRQATHLIAAKLDALAQVTIQFDPVFIAGGLDQAVVQVAVDPQVGLQAPLPLRAAALALKLGMGALQCLPDFQQLFTLQPSSGTHEEGGLDDLPGFEEVVDVLDVQLDHAGAFARDNLDEAVALQTVEGFAQRGAAHPEQLREGLLVERRSGGDLTGDDGVLDGFVDRFDKRAARPDLLQGGHRGRRKLARSKRQWISPHGGESNSSHRLSVYVYSYQNSVKPRRLGAAKNILQLLRQHFWVERLEHVAVKPGGASAFFGQVEIAGGDGQDRGPVAGGPFHAPDLSRQAVAVQLRHLDVRQDQVVWPHLVLPERFHAVCSRFHRVSQRAELTQHDLPVDGVVLGQQHAAHTCPRAGIGGFGGAQGLTFLVAVREGQRDVPEGVLQCQEGVDHIGVEMSASPLADDLNGLRVGKRRLVDPLADQGVVDVGERHQPARDGNRVALEPPRIARAVPFFLVRAGDLARVTQKGALAQLLLGDAERLLADERVLLHLRELGFFQPSGLEQDVIPHADLTHVVQGCGEVEQLDGLRIQQVAETGMVLEVHGQGLQVVLGAFDVAAGLGVAVLGEGRQAFDHDRLGQLHLARFHLHQLLQVVPVVLELQVVAHAGSHQLGVDRFGDVVHHPQSEPFGLVFGFGHGRQENHRDVTGCLGALQPAADLVAVHLRHHDVQQHQVGVGLGNDVQCGPAVLGDQQLVAEPVQVFAQHLEVGGVVVDQEDLGRFRGRLIRRGAHRVFSNSSASFRMPSKSKSSARRMIRGV